MSKDANKKYVLFSPIGNHDPFGFGKNENDVTEGPLLHIIRHYKPEVIILFLTKEMFGKEEKDNRYTTCIKKLFPEYDDSNIVIWEEGHNIENPQNFDEFIVPYGNIFERINNEYPNYEIIYNVSSGTPQMISSIILEAQNSNMPLKAIQVESPERSANFRDKYFDGAWEYIEENKIVNRCVEPHLNVFKQSHLKSQISVLIDNYEYGAAINLLEKSNIKEMFNKNVINLLKHLHYRSIYDLSTARQYASLINDVDSNFIKLLTLNKNVVEYFFTIVLKQKKHELDDMVLKITPFIAKLLRDEVEKLYDLSTIISLSGEKERKIEQITRETLEEKDSKLLDFLDNKFDGKYYDGFVKSQTLKGVLEYKKSTIQFETEKEKNQFNQIDRLFNKFLTLESNIRNIVAHELKSIDENEIKKYYQGLSNSVIKDLGKLLQLTCGYSGKFIYDEINNEIKKLL